MILIADDDQAVRSSISLALSKAGLPNDAVGSEEALLERVRDERTRLVVLDMNLTLSTTGRQGIELLRKIKVLRPEMPVICITAWGTIPLAVEGMAHGAVDFMTKPWSNRDLVDKIRKALSQAEHEARQQASTATLDSVERQAVVKALRQADGNLTAAAAALGITRQALYRRMKKYEI